MQTLQQTLSSSYGPVIHQQSLVSKFIGWCKTQEKYRYGWLAVIIAFHGCVLTPFTVIAITLGSNSIVLWGMAMAAIAMSLVSNLAAMPTKITIPVFFFSILVDLAVIGISLAGH